MPFVFQYDDYLAAVERYTFENPDYSEDAGGWPQDGYGRWMDEGGGKKDPGWYNPW